MDYIVNKRAIFIYIYFETGPAISIQTTRHDPRLNQVITTKPSLWANAHFSELMERYLFIPLPIYTIENKFPDSAIHLKYLQESYSNFVQTCQMSEWMCCFFHFTHFLGDLYDWVSQAEVSWVRVVFCRYNWQLRALGSLPKTCFNEDQVCFRSLLVILVFQQKL